MLFRSPCGVLARQRRASGPRDLRSLAACVVRVRRACLALSVRQDLAGPPAETDSLDGPYLNTAADDNCPKRPAGGCGSSGDIRPVPRGNGHEITAGSTPKRAPGHGSKTVAVPSVDTPCSADDGLGTVSRRTATRGSPGGPPGRRLLRQLRPSSRCRQSVSPRPPGHSRRRRHRSTSR